MQVREPFDRIGKRFFVQVGLKRPQAVTDDLILNGGQSDPIH